MPQADKEKRGEMLQKMLNHLQQKQGLTRALAIERLEEWMQDPIKLRVLNALAGE